MRWAGTSVMCRGATRHRSPRALGIRAAGRAIPMPMGAVRGIRTSATRITKITACWGASPGAPQNLRTPRAQSNRLPDLLFERLADLVGQLGEVGLHELVALSADRARARRIESRGEFEHFA